MAPNLLAGNSVLLWAELTSWLLQRHDVPDITVQLPVKDINHTDHSAMQSIFESKIEYFLKCPNSNPEYDIFLGGVRGGEVGRISTGYGNQEYG